MAAVRTEDEVVLIKIICLTDGRRLLTDGQVSRSRIVVLQTAVVVLRLDRHQHFFELANQAHAKDDIDEIFFSK